MNHQLFDLLFLSSSVALILLVWFNSDAFIEYATFFGLEKFFGIDTYRYKLLGNPTIDWIRYLSENYNSFFIKLITCPLCLSLWVTVVACYLTDSLILIPICNLLSLVFYKLSAKLMEL